VIDERTKLLIYKKEMHHW